MAGALIAAAGIALVVGAGFGPSMPLPVLIALISIPFVLAEGSVIVKIFRPGDPMATNAVALSVGAVMLAAMSLLAGETWRLPSSAPTWAAFGYLIVIGSVMVFYLWLVVLARWPASRSAYGFVLMPVVSVALSAWLTGEVITGTFLAGAAVALGGVWLGGISTAPRAPAPAPALWRKATPACPPAE